MIRWMVTGMMGLAMAIGCDSRQPTIREGPVVGENTIQPPPTMPGPEELGPGSRLRGMNPPGHGQGAPIEGDREVEIGRMQLQAPESWERMPPRSRIVLAEFSLPRAEGDGEDARLTVTSVGGTVDENITLWRMQFGGKVENESIDTIEVAGIQITLVDLSGSYSGQHGGVGPANVLANHRMLAAIINLPAHQHVVKCYGPERTIAKHAAAFEAFIRSLNLPGDNPSNMEPMQEAPAESNSGASESIEATPGSEEPSV